MLRFNVRYFILTLLLFITEVLIAKYLTDAIIRPYGGDFLVVMLMYCFVKSFLNTRVMPTAIGVLLFSYLIEISQYFNLVNKVGLGNFKIARIVMGTYFTYVDLLCYTLGVLVILIIEKICQHKRPFK